ncbi:MAG TPA: SDR family oxidoreductase [Flavobacteriales bacterium]|nr:SDR family oxidoreductase [Flavobacteriales bacterium]HRE96640.1 SDR family oxidoreductase [Flavobacteriales bacterium]HRJ34438.1 SDR family oxidoreductase [Flavobacteriales bacterium]HRJ39535.1 SDR family oxidoreductase [Flavobacteriales bacterium]
MKFFLTGGTGYIGSWMIRRLTERGHEVHALVRNPEKAKSIQNDLVKLFRGDMLDEEAIRRGMEGCDGVFHLAAFAKVWARDPKVFFDQNVVATNRILDAARDLGVKRTVVTSTAGVFGASLHGTITEESARDLDFFNEYESSKALSESKIKDYVIRGLDVVIVSPTRVYGPALHGSPESVTLLIDKFVNGSWRFIPGDGTKIGNYVFVEDVVEGHILAMEKGKKGETYILGGSNHDYNEFFGKLSELSGVKRSMIKMPIGLQMMFSRFQLLKTKFGGEPLITPKWIAKGKYDWKVDASKAVRELGMIITPLETGLKRTIDWSRERRKQ